MKGYTFRVGRATFKYMIITDGRGSIMVDLGCGDGDILSYLVVARGYWLSAKDHLGEIFSLINITHRGWVTEP